MARIRHQPAWNWPPPPLHRRYLVPAFQGNSFSRAARVGQNSVGDVTQRGDRGGSDAGRRLVMWRVLEHSQYDFLCERRGG